MIITSVHIQNFRKLFRCRIDFSKETTVFVGANNSGKTSAMHALAKFLADRTFVLNDFTMSNRTRINSIGERWTSKDCKMPQDIIDWEAVLPKMDIWLDVPRSQIYQVANLIPTLSWRGGRLGVRLMYQPKEVSKLFTEYREAYYTARKTEALGVGSLTSVNLYPRDLCDFLEKKLGTYFSVKSYTLDPSRYSDEVPQATPFGMECFVDNPLRKIIKVDMIYAQRGFADPDASDGAEKTSGRLSSQLSNYYEKHLDPEKMPSVEDLRILEVTATAKTAFDETLATKFAAAIGELQNLGYPGINDPKITISTQVKTAEALRHEAAVQYALGGSDSRLRLPEKYNGLGYQNLISMVFELMGCRDAWLRIGKAEESQVGDSVIVEPLHLVLIEEPEAHLHMQVQQVFIRQAYSVLRGRPCLGKNCELATQLVVSTHSSHIAREMPFADLRYFKRLPESVECGVATARVINLTEVFGNEDNTDRFVTRYLRTTHCDLFFADAVILVEGSAESMLVPHFIRNNYKTLHHRYISILSINGRHSHRLAPLVEKLCLPTLVIADLDSSEPNGRHKAARPRRKKGLISGNYAVSSWIVKEKSLDTLFDLPSEQKVINNHTPYEHPIRIAYQTPVTVKHNGRKAEALSSTFEDCMVYTNYELFKGCSLVSMDGLVKKIHTAIVAGKPFSKLHQEIYSLLREGRADQKAEFALDLIFAVDPSALIVPEYIAEGLEWLQNLLHLEEVKDDKARL